MLRNANPVDTLRIFKVVFYNGKLIEKSCMLLLLLFVVNLLRKAVCTEAIKHKQFLKMVIKHEFL